MRSQIIHTLILLTFIYKPTYATQPATSSNELPQLTTLTTSSYVSTTSSTEALYTPIVPQVDSPYIIKTTAMEGTVFIITGIIIITLFTFITLFRLFLFLRSKRQAKDFEEKFVPKSYNYDPSIFRFDKFSRECSTNYGGSTINEDISTVSYNKDYYNEHVADSVYSDEASTQVYSNYVGSKSNQSFFNDSLPIPSQPGRSLRTAMNNFNSNANRSSMFISPVLELMSNVNPRPIISDESVTSYAYNLNHSNVSRCESEQNKKTRTPSQYLDDLMFDS